MGFYLLIAVVLLMTIFALRGGMGNQEKVTYAQVRQLLEQQMVSRVSLEDNTVTLYLKEPQGGQSVLTYQIGNPDWFYQDFNDLIVEQKRQGIITDYDYPQGWVPPYWMSFIPWIVILVVFGLLWYFMFLRQAGAGGGGGGGGGVDRTARFGRARTRTGADEQKKVTFGDVAGAEEEKGELQEIVEFLRDPKRFLELGARIPKGVLLVGRAPARPCWPRPWPARRGFTSSPSPAPTLWSSTWAWAPPASATCLTRPRRTPPPSSLLMRSTLWAASAAPAWGAATTNGSRP